MLDEKTPYEESYRDLIIDEHRDKPKFMLTVDAVLKYNTDIYSVAVYLDDDFDLDESTGAQEDILGELVGEKRELDFQPLTQETPILNDDDFRVLLKSKIAKNHWDGTVDNLQEIWKSLFNENIKITDNQDMTMDVTIDNVPSSVVHEMIYRGKIIPKPQSVGIKYNLDISMLDYEDAMDFMVESLKEDSGNSNIIKKGSIDKVTISGNKYAKQVINFYDKKSGLHLESILIMGIKNNELWFVTISYKNGDVKANAFANKIMSTVDLK